MAKKAASKMFYGTGRRKKSIARVYITPGKGEITINNRSLDDYFGLETLKVIVRQPLVAIEGALENMMLMANSLDLGSVWINQLRWLNENPVLLEAMREIGLEDDERVYGALAIGYADSEDGLPLRKPLERTGNKVTFVR